MGKLMRLFITLIFCFTFILPAAAQQSPPDDFGTLPAIYDAAISPDGKQLALYINIKGEYGIRVVNVDESTRQQKPRVVLLAKGSKPRWIKWANNEQVLAAFWQNEKLRGTPLTMSYIFTVNSKTMDGKILVKPPRGVLRQNNSQIIDYLEDDPDHILMAFARNSQGSPDVRKVDVHTGQSDRLKGGLDKVQYWYTDQRGEPRIGQGQYNKSATETAWYMTVRDADQDKWRKIEEFPGLKPDTDIVGFTADPNELIIRSRNGKDTVGLYTYNLQSKSLGRSIFHDDTYDASGVVLSADGTEILGAKLVSDAAETRMLTGKTTVLDRMRQKFAGANIDYIDQSYDKRYVLFKASGGFYPGDLLMVDTQTDALTQFGSYYPQLSTEELGTVQSIKYRARDGFKVPAYITLPPKVEQTGKIENIPFIILPHGGPYARSSERFDYFAQFFATQGYGVLQMNFRGSAGYGQAYQDAGRENWVLMQEDVEDGARWLVEKGYADPNKMCIAGWSYGGYVSLMGAVKHSDLYSCSISMAGVTDIPDLINDAKKYRFGAQIARNSIISGFEGGRDMKNNSPARQTDQIKIPVFIAHGTADQRVHFDQYERMVLALKRDGVRVTTMEFEDEDHFLSNEKNRKRFFNGVSKFLVQVNGKSPYAND